ncbi:insulinase family protein, partial [bacterium]|nr:insulinase family protein [bacterium]
AALANLVRDILKRRADSKLNKGTILNAAMFNYGTWGKKSPFTNILSESELAGLKPSELTDLIKGLNRYPHRVLYYGPLPKEKLTACLDRLHNVPEAFERIPEPVKFEQLPTEENKVFVCDYDMKQAEIVMLSRSVPYDRTGMAIRALFNEYYGGNMSSVVFQTLRESKALAYSVWGAYLTPDRPEHAHYIETYIGTQADKIDLALSGMFDLLNNMPETPHAFADCKEAIVKRIQTERITKGNILWTYEQAKRMGNDDRDRRADVYEQVPGMTLADLRAFFDKYIRDKNYTILVLGDVEKLDFGVLKKYGKVKKLSLEEVFGY